MKTIISLALAGVLLSAYAGATTNTPPLVEVNTADYGDTNCLIRIVELERNANTSKLKLTYRKLGSSVGSSMFIMSGFYEVARARQTEYFINLKEWEDSDGGRFYIAGFTNTKDADIHREFGPDYALSNEYGQARGYMSVSQCNMIFGGRRKTSRPAEPLSTD